MKLSRPRRWLIVLATIACAGAAFAAPTLASQVTSAISFDKQVTSTSKCVTLDFTDASGDPVLDNVYIDLVGRRTSNNQVVIHSYGFATHGSYTSCVSGWTFVPRMNYTAFVDENGDGVHQAAETSLTVLNQ